MSSFDTLEKRATELIDEYKSNQEDKDFSLTSYQQRAAKLIKDHEITKKSSDCDALINTFKALMAENLLVDADLRNSTYILVKRCIKNPNDERLAYVLAILLDQISFEEAKQLLFTFIAKCYRDKLDSKSEVCPF